MSTALLLLNKPKDWLDIYVNSITSSAQSVLNSLKLTGTSNQLVFRPGDSGNSITISGSTPSANRTLTLPDETGTVAVSSSGSFSMTFDGIWAAPVTVTVDYVKSGKVVSFSCPSVLATATNSAGISSTTFIPAGLVPLRTTSLPLRVRDNGAWPTTAGLLKIFTDGTMSVTVSLNGLTGFTAANQAGFEAFSFTYPVA